VCRIGILREKVERDMSMLELKGNFNTAKVFNDKIDEVTKSQVMELLNNKLSEGSKIRFMSDIHAGAGCVIGTTMTIIDKVVPNFVGVDIGCGMLLVEVLQSEIDFVKLDSVINEGVPAGFNVRDIPHSLSGTTRVEELYCGDDLDLDNGRILRSLGTLGGGNHFIEVGKDGDGKHYLIIHTGSRSLGKAVATWYQKEAIKQVKLAGSGNRGIVDSLKLQGRYSEIQEELRKQKAPKIPTGMEYVTGSLLEDYLHDMDIVQGYARVNRDIIASIIIDGMGFTVGDSFHTVHNYIDIEDKILRKGAVSAKEGEVLIIPMNMRDGSLLCVGKGNPDWNYSSPHGAGRLMGRNVAKGTLSMEEFQISMEGVYTTSVNLSTLDESPFAYKPMEEIISHIGDTVDVLKVLKPVYNFKFSGE
jgi:tRNA-splicing ligase RtcB (3'-phosphate/5'-hydroxy nucleic acid ligase)